MSSATESSETKQQWLDMLDALIQDVKTWCEAEGWSTRKVAKTIRDSRLGVYEAPALLLQHGVNRVLLEPISHAAPGADGVVDLYLLPAYDDIASLYLENGIWQLHYMQPGTPTKPTIREAESRPLTSSNLQQVLDEMIKNADQI